MARMNTCEEKRLIIWFAKYTRQFAGASGKLAPMLQLKLEHSRRVAGQAADIAQDLDFAAPARRAAKILGLFHDIGRFNQFARHRTFRDELSFNHGQHGAAIMESCAALKACCARDRRRIIAGIRHHNRANLPAGFETDILNFIKIGRDADKLDIFQILYQSWKNGDLRKSPDITLMVKLDGPINPAALADIRRRQTVSMRNVKSLADFFLLQLSWVYDLNFPPSYRRMLARHVIEQIAEALPESPAVKEQLALAREHANKQLAGKHSGFQSV